MISQYIATQKSTKENQTHLGFWHYSVLIENLLFLREMYVCIVYKIVRIKFIKMYAQTSAPHFSTLLLPHFINLSDLFYFICFFVFYYLFFSSLFSFQVSDGFSLNGLKTSFIVSGLKKFLTEIG